MGKIKIRFAEKNNFGILDHDIILGSGGQIHNPISLGGTKHVFGRGVNERRRASHAVFLGGSRFNTSWKRSVETLVIGRRGTRVAVRAVSLPGRRRRYRPRP